MAEVTDFESLLRVLVEGEVRFILIGGVAAGRPKDLEAVAELEEQG